MFHVMFSLPCLYVILCYLGPMPWPLSAKLVAAVALLLGSQYHLYARLSSGSVSSPELPRALLIFLNWTFGAILLLAVLQIAVDVGTLLTMLVRQQLLTVPTGLRYGIGAAAMLLAAVGVQQAVRVPPVKNIDIRITNLPAQFEGYQVVQLTDLHISRLFDRAWAESVVARTNAVGADMIVVTGDLIDGSILHRASAVEPLRALQAPDGAYVIPGNHEYFFDGAAWMRHFEGLGMVPLENAHRLVTREGATLAVAGVTDLTAPRTGLAPPDLEQALNGVPEGTPVILLDHQPRNARLAAKRGVALQLSGHTHGGMILGLDRVVASANAGFVSGLYSVGGMQLYVNNGTALWAGFAIRLGRPSELTCITLRRAAAMDG